MGEKDLSVSRNPRVRILTACAILTFLLVAASVGIGRSPEANTALDQSDQRAVQLLESIASCAATLVSVYMDARATDMLACSSTSGSLKAALLKPEERAKAKAVLAQWLSTYRAYDAMLLLDKKGVCLAAAPDGLEDGDFSTEPAFKEALSGKLGLSDTHKSDTIRRLNPESGGWTAAVAAPVRVGNDMEGVLLSYLKWSQLQDLANGVVVWGTGYVFLLNGHNQFILHPAGASHYGWGLNEPRIQIPSLDEAVRKRAPYHSHEFTNPKTGKQDVKLIGGACPKAYGHFPGLGWTAGAVADRTEILGEPSFWKRFFR